MRLDKRGTTVTVHTTQNTPVIIIYHRGAVQARGSLTEIVDNQPFWRVKSLEELTPQEWESLCDGCGRCCLVKLEDEDSGEVHLTRLACRLLDHGSCRCKDYANRHKVVHDCLAIDPEKVRSIDWLPRSCGYRRVAEKRDLAWWHPLISGDPNTVHEAGISVRDWAQSEGRIKVSSYHRYIIKDFEDE